MKLAFSNSMAYRYASGDPEARGGAEKAQWLLARAIAEAGWSVTVGVPGLLPFGHAEVIDGVRFAGIGPANGPREFLSAWSRLLSAERPDWWYWRSADPLWGALVVIAKAKGIRGIFAAGFDRDVHPRAALVRRRHWWPLYAWGLKAVDRIFVQHTGQWSGLGRKLRPKAAIVPGVVALPAQVKTFAERDAYVAWVAVLRQPKRPDLLIEIARKTPDLRYVVCGGASTHRTPPGYSQQVVSELRSLPNVEYLGHVDPRETLEIIGNASALLSTSDQEGFPNTFLEAWSAGTPVVTLRIDPSGLIRKRGLGFVSGTVDQAASDLRKLLDSPDGFEAVSMRARNYVEDVHSARAVARVFDRALKGVS